MEPLPLASWVADASRASGFDAPALIEALARALAAHHAAGHVHGDLTPTTVRVAREDDRWRVTLAPSPSPVASQWRAPEALEGEARLRPSADVWSLGLIAFWLLAGRAYWRRADGDGWSSAVREEILTSRIVRPSDRAAELGLACALPEGFDGWFSQAVSPDATGRFRDAGRALEALPWRTAPVTLDAPTAPKKPVPTVFSAPTPAPFGAAEPAPSRRLRRIPLVLAATAAVALPLAAIGLRAHRTPPAAAAAHTGHGRVIDVAAGAGHSCAAFEDGAVFCWGANNHHQLGADATLHGEPVRAVISGRATRVAAGEEHTCVTLAGGGVECFGKNTSGQLGGPTAPPTGAMRVPGVDATEGLALAVFHSCARLRDGTVRCWGTNAHGQLGDGTAEARNAPVAPQDQADIEALAAGGSDTCAVRRGGTVHCWGVSYGSGPGAGPQEVAGLSDVTQVSVGTGDACALSRDGRLHCWSAIRC